MIIVISGTGRSGTHLLGNILGSSENSLLRQERGDTFNVAYDRIRSANFDFSDLTSVIEKEYKNYKNIIEKNHVLMWAENIEFSFNKYKFIGIERDVQCVISSSIKHAAILKRTSQHQAIINPFFGIVDKETLDLYNTSSVPQRLYMKHVTHHHRLKELSSIEMALVIKFEDILYNYEDTVQKIEEYCQIKVKFSKENIRDVNIKSKNCINKDHIRTEIDKFPKDKFLIAVNKYFSEKTK